MLMNTANVPPPSLVVIVTSSWRHPCEHMPKCSFHGNCRQAAVPGAEDCEVNYSGFRFKPPAIGEFP